MTPASPPAASRTASSWRPNGWVLYIGRGDCRTDAERGALLGGRSLGAHPRPRRRRTSASAAAASTSGIPTSTTGTVNSGVTRAGTLAVYGDGGTGGERTDQANHKMEYGLARRHARARLHRDRPHLPAVLPDLRPGRARRPGSARTGASRRCRGRASRASRWTSTPSSSTSTPRCGSSSTTPRSTAAATSAAAWASTPRATSTSRPATRTRRREPAATRATTRRRSARPGRRRAVERALRRGDVLLPGRAPDGGQHQRLQRQDAAVQADRTIPDGDQPTVGVGTTYTLPDGGLAERPEPVQRHRGRRRQDASPRSTPWACATRPGSRSTRRPTSRTRHGSARTPARRAPTDGPSTYENAAQISRAGNYGWPYCMGNGQAYRDRLADGTRGRRTRPATCPAARPPAAPTAGTTATTSSTTRPTTRA